MKSIYIMLTRSETILSRLVYLVTRDAYTHASIAAYRQQVFFLRLRRFEIFIFCAEWIVLLVCEVVKGYFSFVFPVPRPYRRIHGVADNNSTKGMECVNDMLLVFFCTGHRNSPFLPYGVIYKH